MVTFILQVDIGQTFILHYFDLMEYERGIRMSMRFQSGKLKDAVRKIRKIGNGTITGTREEDDEFSSDRLNLGCLTGNVEQAAAYVSLKVRKRDPD